MTISRKLYLGFGSIMVILVLLFITNSIVVMKERAASGHAVALESVQKLEAVQLKMMQRLACTDYLLTGDVRQREDEQWRPPASPICSTGAAERADRFLRDVLSGWK